MRFGSWTIGFRTKIFWSVQQLICRRPWCSSGGRRGCACPGASAAGWRTSHSRPPASRATVWPAACSCRRPRAPWVRGQGEQSRSHRSWPTPLAGCRPWWAAGGFVACGVILDGSLCSLYHKHQVRYVMQMTPEAHDKRRDGLPCLLWRVRHACGTSASTAWCSSSISVGSYRPSVRHSHVVKSRQHSQGERRDSDYGDPSIWIPWGRSLSNKAARCPVTRTSSWAPPLLHMVQVKPVARPWI